MRVQCMRVYILGVSPDDDEDDNWLMCKRCKKWYHVACELGVNYDDALPETFRCHSCVSKYGKIDFQFVIDRISLAPHYFSPSSYAGFVSIETWF